MKPHNIHEQKSMSEKVTTPKNSAMHDHLHFAVTHILHHRDPKGKVTGTYKETHIVTAGSAEEAKKQFTKHGIAVTQVKQHQPGPDEAAKKEHRNKTKSEHEGKDLSDVKAGFVKEEVTEHDINTLSKYGVSGRAMKGAKNYLKQGFNHKTAARKAKADLMENTINKVINIVENRIVASEHGTDLDTDSSDKY